MRNRFHLLGVVVVGGCFAVLTGCPRSNDAELPRVRADADPANATAPAATADLGTPTSNPPTPPSSPVPTQAQLVPGIDEPLSVEGGDIQLQLTTVTKMDTYSANPGADLYRPQSETDIFLVVKAKILSGDLGKVGRMPVSIIDENGRETGPGVTTVFDNRKEIVWPVTVARSSHSFTLRLPDNHVITLDSLISSVPSP